MKYTHNSRFRITEIPGESCIRLVLIFWLLGSWSKNEVWVEQ